MQDGISNVNDLVQKAAEANKESNSSDNQEKDKIESGDGSGENLTDDQKAEKELADKKVLEDAEAAKSLAEAGKDKQPDLVAEFLKDTKFESLDALKKHLAKSNESQKSPEEIKREEEIYNANLVSYAVENGIMKMEEITKYENLKGKDDEMLVFESFHGEMKDLVEEQLIAEKKEAGDESEPTVQEIEDRINEEFEKEYPLESKNEKLKNRAQNKLAKAAKEIRQPIESSYTSAKEKYNEERGLKQEFPKYVSKMNELIAAGISEELTAYSEKDEDEDVVASIKLSAEERLAITEKAFKKVSTAKMYKLYQDGKFDEIAEILKDETDAIIWKDYRERGLAKVAEVFKNKGFSKGSSVGAKESFATKQGKGGKSDKQDAVSAQQSVIDSTRAKKQ